MRLPEALSLSTPYQELMVSDLMGRVFLVQHGFWFSTVESNQLWPIFFQVRTSSGQSSFRSRGGVHPLKLLSGRDPFPPNTATTRMSF